MRIPQPPPVLYLLNVRQHFLTGSIMKSHQGLKCANQISSCKTLIHAVLCVCVCVFHSKHTVHEEM